MTTANDGTRPALWPSDGMTEMAPHTADSGVQRRRFAVIGPRAQRAQTVPICDLVRAGSPRSTGQDEAHVERLAEAEGPLPPILVHRLTMRIVDGFHRVAAAQRRGQTEIEAYLLDESLEAAFVTAVESNVTHGLPLSSADRRRAAVTILAAYPHWSDRAIAKSTGLSGKTVAGIRCAAEEDQQLHARVGSDGRSRPLDPTAGRRLAAELIAARPDASLREIAHAAGISPGTVRDVRSRLSRGEDPVAGRGIRRDAPQRGKRMQARNQLIQSADVNPVLATLSRDPAMRMNEVARDTLRWLHQHAVNSVDGNKIADTVPEHCLEHLVEFATRCSANWAKIAGELAQRSECGKPTVLRIAEPEPPIEQCS
jgi:ParB-like chromosome segregation protein Spo0J